MNKFEKLMGFLEGLKMTIVGGIFLLISLILLITNTTLPIDPAWVTIVICGLPLLYLALSRLVYEHWVSSALLICIAMVASLMIGEIFAAGEVVFIMALGALLEDYTVRKSKQGLRDLINLKPQTGRLLIKENGDIVEKEIKVQEIKKEDKLRVLPGEVIPVDGIIISGDTSVDQSVMTGESLPLDKTVNDEVYAGTLNLYGAIDIISTKIGKDSSLEKLIRMVKEAESNKADDEKKRKDIETKNKAEAMINQIDKALAEQGANLPEDQKKQATALRDELKTALDNNDMATLESKMSELEQIAQQMAAAQYQQQNTGNTAGADTSSNNNNDDFVDADFTEKN